MNLNRLYPNAKQIIPYEGQYHFGAKMQLHISGNLIIPRLMDRLRENWFGFTRMGGILEVYADSEAGGTLEPEKGIFAYLTENNPKELKYPELLTHADSYCLEISQHGIGIAARDMKAFVNALSTVFQLIVTDCLEEGRELFHVPCLIIHDNPSLAIRGLNICIFPETNWAYIEKAILLAGLLKLTHIELEFWSGTLQFDTLKELAWKDRSYSKEHVRPLINLANSCGLEVIPMFNCFGHAALCRYGNGRHVVLDQNPRLSMLFEPDGWNWCVSNPDTIKILTGVCEELIELCGEGSYFHIGGDETWTFGTCERCRTRPQNELFTEHANDTALDLLARGRRPIMWHDQLLHADPSTGGGQTFCGCGGSDNSRMLDKLDKRIIIADWQYDFKHGCEPTSKYFIDRGFDTLLCPWDSPANVRALCQSALDNDATGVLLTTWHHLPEYLPFLPVASEWAWNGGGLYSDYPDSIEGRPVEHLAADSLIRCLYWAPDFNKAGYMHYEVGTSSWKYAL